MESFNRIRQMAVTAAAGAALLSGVAFAQTSADMDAQAAEIEQAIATMPEYNSASGPISVDAVDGRIVLTGFVNSMQQMNEIEAMLQEMEGLDMESIDNNIVQQ